MDFNSEIGTSVALRGNVDFFPVRRYTRCKRNKWLARTRLHTLYVYSLLENYRQVFDYPVSSSTLGIKSPQPLHLCNCLDLGPLRIHWLARRIEGTSRVFIICLAGFYHGGTCCESLRSKERSIRSAAASRGKCPETTDLEIVSTHRRYRMSTTRRNITMIMTRIHNAMETCQAYRSAQTALVSQLMSITTPNFSWRSPRDYSLHSQ